ncbi:putative membrane protein [Bradyrhizobium sp. WSM1253]|nr:putative membrane protein [Bradyrhizobium sp. WSM1253]
MVIAVASFAAFLQVLGEACTQASNSLVTGRGEGWGYSRLSGYRKSDTDRQGFPRALPFPFVHLRRAGKGDYLQGLSIAPESEAALDSPPNSPPQDPPSQDASLAVPAVVEEAPREPILTLPFALTAYILLLAVIHLRVLLPPELENWTIDVFGFIPKRYDSSLLNLEIPGGAGAKVWTFVTYSLLHANLTHIGFNVLWLLPFGSALARRFGAIRFFLFLAVTAAAGALAHLVTHEHAVAPMIGASASVSGAMAAAIRFAFVRGSFLSFSRSDADTAARVPALPLSRALRDGRVLGFLAVWFGVNIVFGVGAIGVDSETTSVAWQAHIGGFLAGLLLFTLFDPVPRVRSDAADASSQDISGRI